MTYLLGKRKGRKRERRKWKKGKKRKEGREKERETGLRGYIHLAVWI